MKSGLNFLGAIAAGVLSVILVLMLIVAPVAFSAISLLNADTITDTVIAAIASMEEESQPMVDGEEIAALPSTGGSFSAESIGEDIVASLFGDMVEHKQLQGILASDVAKELLGAYAKDLIGTITGNDQKTNFTEEKVKEILHDNMGELVEILQTNAPEFAEMDTEELINKIEGSLDGSVEKIMDVLPEPEEVKRQVIDENLVMRVAIDFFAMEKAVKTTMIVGIVVLSVLIFVCRLPGAQGFCWLGVDLLIAGGINGIVTLCLLIGKAAIGKISQIAGAQLVGLINSLLNTFTGGVLTRTLVMVAFGIVMLLLYILFGKRTKKEEKDRIRAEMV